MMPGSAVKDPGTRDQLKYLDSDRTRQTTAPLIDNGEMKGIVSIFYNEVSWVFSAGLVFKPVKKKERISVKGSY